MFGMLTMSGLGDWGLPAPIDGRSLDRPLLLLALPHRALLELPAHDPHAVSVVSLERVCRVEERKLGVLTLVLADFLLVLGRVRRPRDNVRSITAMMQHSPSVSCTGGEM